MKKSKQSVTKSSKTKLNINARISALSSGNASKYEFLTGKDVLPEKDLLDWIFAVRKRIEKAD